MNFVIRDAAMEDFEQVAELEQHLFRYHEGERPDLFDGEYRYTREEFAKLLSYPGRIALVAEGEGVLMGLCFGQVEKDSKHPVLRPTVTAEIEDLVVSPAFRGQGIARALLEKAQTRAAELGAERIQLGVWYFNENAAHLYRSLGFETAWSKMEKRLT
ncbi:MAG: GNAT family N-acetyltransferase [Oscillospiraceae bacterium]|jgi:ribosomal protein S18 acetylase RimI-like enzyme|nr:GNAT family N-acetyltransferase [Oscillospiraceae bacterium]